MTLAETQALFRVAVTDGDSLPAERLEACFVGTPALPAAARVAIYAGMYLARLVDALRATFPAVAAVAGDDDFVGLARDYLRRHPSEHHDVAQAGRLLPAFLRRHPDPGRPDLADLATLEWARQEVFFAPPAAPVAPDALAAVPADRSAGARLSLSPALRLLRLDHAVGPVWRSTEDGLPPPPAAPGRSALAVWRSGFDVFHGELPPEEADALEAALLGAPLAEVCAAFAAQDGAAVAAHAAISSWLSEGWVVGIAPGEAPP